MGSKVTKINKKPNFLYNQILLYKDGPRAERVKFRRCRYDWTDLNWTDFLIAVPSIMGCLSDDMHHWNLDMPHCHCHFSSG